jgi:glycosyltransferase involved in cell wall biosynthesis
MHSILFMAQLPPPVHGAALRNKSLLDSELLNNEFKIINLPLKFISDMKDLGKLSLKKLFLMLQHCIKMTGLLLTRKIDVVYFTMSPSGGAFYRDILFITIIKLFRKKRILHFRVKGIQKTASRAIGRMLVKYAFRNSEVVCLSNHHMLDMAGVLHRKPYLVPNGIKVETQFLHLADEYVPNTIPHLLFVSNLSVKKGVVHLIKACGILKSNGYRFTCGIVGNEWDLTFADVHDLIRNENVGDCVEVEGPRFGKEKFERIARCDIFVFPTYFELFPGVILEAMQFGKAIVSTFEGSIPEMIDNKVNGILVQQQNTEALAAAISSLFDKPEKMQELGAKARKKFFDEFTLQAFESKMHSVFRDVINK